MIDVVDRDMKEASAAEKFARLVGLPPHPSIEVVRERMAVRAAARLAARPTSVSRGGSYASISRRLSTVDGILKVVDAKSAQMRGLL